MTPVFEFCVNSNREHIVKHTFQTLRALDYGVALVAAIGTALIVLLAPALHAVLQGALELGAESLGNLERQILSRTGVGS